MSTDKRYYIGEFTGQCHTVLDRHFPNNVVAFCYDEHKANLIMWLLNDSWDKARKRSE